jgi:hypothetical protein
LDDARAGRARDLRLLVFRAVERVAAFGLDLGLVMGSSGVHATPSAAPPQPRPGKSPGRARPRSRLSRSKSPQQRSNRTRKPVISEQDNCSSRGQSHRRFESPLLRQQVSDITVEKVSASIVPSLPLVSERSSGSWPLREGIPCTFHVQRGSFLRTRLCQWLSSRIMAPTRECSRRSAVMANFASAAITDAFKRPSRCRQRVLHGIEGSRLPNRLQKRYQIIENRRKKIRVEGEFNNRWCPHRGKPFRQRRVRSP